MKPEEIDIIEVISKSDLKRFIKFPWKVYADDPNWVPPLITERLAFFDRKKNPFYRYAKVQLFLAIYQGEVLGRIATCVNNIHNQFHQEKTGFFGFFESVQNYDVAYRLLKVAVIALKTVGMEQMLGPANFSTNHELGLLVDAFDQPPVVQMSYNPAYYVDYFERFGLTKAKDLLAFKMVKENEPPERMVKIVERIRERSGATFRKIDLHDFDNEILKVIKVYNDAWESNWGFVPLHEDEFIHIAKDLKQIVDPDLALFAEIDGEPAGFALAIPDINQILIKLNGRLFPFGLFKLLWNFKVRRKVNQVRVITMGVVKKYQKRGIDNVFYLDLYRNGVAKGYYTAELSWILEENHLMISPIETLGGKRYKTYRMYHTPLITSPPPYPPDTSQ
jgi:hypothetical protein